MKEHDIYFDNAKLILIYLVILLHTVEHIAPNNYIFSLIWIIVYYFHMPAFAFISGRFASGKKDLPRLIVYYIVAEVIYYPVYFNEGTIFLRPYYALWFILCLIFWNLLLPLIDKVKYPILWSFVLGIAIGYVSLPSILSLTRMVTFFPFFALGHVLRKKRFEFLSSCMARALSVIALSGIWLMIGFGVLSLSKTWLWQCYSYSQMGLDVWYAGIYRILLYVNSIITCICFFSLVPRRRFAFSYLGGNTLYPYVFHPFFVLFARDTGYYVALGESWGGIVLIISTAIIVVFLSTNAFKRVIGYGLNPLVKCAQRFIHPNPIKSMKG